MALDGSTLRSLAAFVGADIDAPVDLGPDVPPLGDPDAPLVIDAASVAELASWYDFAWRVLDEVVARVDGGSVIQIWPEHFDAAVDVAVAPDRRVNLGASPGDGFRDRPYLYVGPWGPERPGDGSYWNAPFGAVAEERDADRAVAFMLEGINRLRT
jgi:hypothetical protein